MPDTLDEVDLAMLKLRIELFAALQSPNRRVRELAWQIVDDIKDIEVVTRPKEVGSE
jgi:hypothetical protein